MDYYYKRMPNTQEGSAENLRDLWQMNKQFKAPMIDRTGCLDSGHAVLSPVPDYPTEDLNYSDICDERAKELLAKSQDENLELRVAYSGGMDSTTALCGLLKFKDDYPGADIKICMNQKSIDEYPLFYENYIKDKLDVYMGDVLLEEGMGENESLGMNFAKDTGKDYFLVTGEIGDQIFGAKMVLNSLEDNDKPYEEVFSSSMVDYIKPLIDKMPTVWGDKNCGNVLCWMNFVMKYQWCQLRMYIMFDIPWAKYEHFFDTDKFQQWTLQTPPQVRWPNFDVKLYKLPTKDYIKAFNGDEEYFINKEKENSMKNTVCVFKPLKDNPNCDRSIWESVDTNFVKKQICLPPTSVNVLTQTSSSGSTTRQISMRGISIEL